MNEHIGSCDPETTYYVKLISQQASKRIAARRRQSQCRIACSATTLMKQQLNSRTALAAAVAAWPVDIRDWWVNFGCKSTCYGHQGIECDLVWDTTKTPLNPYEVGEWFVNEQCFYVEQALSHPVWPLSWAPEDNLGPLSRLKS